MNGLDCKYFSLNKSRLALKDHLCGVCLNVPAGWQSIHPDGGVRDETFFCGRRLTLRQPSCPKHKTDTYEETTYSILPHLRPGIGDPRR
jgi:hypothetical protein